MANYNCFSRTNYFKVTDPEALRKIVEKVGAEFWTEFDEPEKEGTEQRYGFGNYDPITSYYDEDKDEDIEIFDELQAILPDGEVAIIMEVGYEKLRYLVGAGIVITNKEIHTIDLGTETAKYAESLGAKNIKMQY